jgi:tripartite-type tricarboxylate transporter receptor subunit TctC
LLKIRITGVVLAAFALVGVAFAEGTAHAQTYPTHPIRLILPFPAGGPSDIISRVFGAKLGEVLGQQVVSDNRGGASGMIGAEIAARAAPDGYTIFLGTIGVLTLNPNLYQKLPYDPVRDFQPVSLLSSSPYILLVTPSLPAKSIRELVALAKSRPGQLNYASGGVGTGNHLSGELFKLAAGVNITHVPFKGASVAVGDVIAGNARARASGDCTTLTASALSRAITARGVFDGAMKPFHGVWSKPGTPDSAMVGTSGAAEERVAEVTAMARTLPERTCGRIDTMVTNASWTWPAINAMLPGPPPLNGTCTMSTPVI